MKSPLIQQFECYPLSSARRLFVLEQIWDHHIGEAVGDRCRSVMEIDRILLRRQRERRRPLRENEFDFLHRRAPLSSLDKLNGEAHRRFIALIRYILRSKSEKERRELLAPALRQLERLQQFTHRTLLDAGADEDSAGNVKRSSPGVAGVMRSGL